MLPNYIYKFIFQQNEDGIYFAKLLRDEAYGPDELQGVSLAITECPTMGIFAPMGVLVQDAGLYWGFVVAPSAGTAREMLMDWMAPASCIRV